MLLLLLVMTRCWLDLMILDPMLVKFLPLMVPGFQATSSSTILTNNQQEAWMPRFVAIYKAYIGEDREKKIRERREGEVRGKR